MKNKHKPVFIYCLKDPITGEVRYIGKTDNLKKRLREHLVNSSKFRSHLGNWLRGLKGKKPILVVLHAVAENESWQEEERRYISCARAIGIKLVNATDGGEGGSLGPLPLEWRAALSASWTPERREAQRLATPVKKGDVLRPESRAAVSASWTPERRAARSKAQTGVKLSPEHCAAIGAVKKGIPLPPRASHGSQCFNRRSAEIARASCGYECVVDSGTPCSRERRT